MLPFRIAADRLPPHLSVTYHHDPSIRVDMVRRTPPSTPDRLADRYVIEREMGRGGMATVYFAYDARHDRHVALKLLRPEFAGAVSHDRFIREIQQSLLTTDASV